MPLPKPSATRRRRNPPAMPTVHVPATRSATASLWGEPDSAWHPLAQETYRNLAASQQAELAQPSDISLAKFACEGMSRCLGGTKFSALAFKAVCDALNDLGASLGSRLRLRLDLERVAPEVGGVDATLRRWGVIKGGAG
jgi:hypothetical protein